MHSLKTPVLNSGLVKLDTRTRAYLTGESHKSSPATIVSCLYSVLTFAIINPARPGSVSKAARRKLLRLASSPFAFDGCLH